MPSQESLNFDEITARVLAICEGEDDPIALMATISCELYHAIDGFDWVGFYRVTSPAMLKIGPYQGGHGCLTIPFDRGVCGAAARLQETQLVDNVEEFDGHIACSSSTQSELVVPFYDAQGALIGVFDIDSDSPAFFTEAHQGFVENLLSKVFGNITI